MSGQTTKRSATIMLVVGSLLGKPSLGQQVKLVERAADPHGSPRPARDAAGRVRCGRASTSSWGRPGGQGRRGQAPTPWPSACVREGGEAVELLRPGRRVRRGRSGWLRPKSDLSGGKVARRLHRAGRAARSPRRDLRGARVGRPRRARPGDPRTPAPGASPPRRPPRSISLEFPLDLESRAGPLARPVLLGALQRHLLHPGGELRADVRADGRGPQAAPRAWSYQRDFWPTGTEFRPATFLAVNLPNIVRERETRRIAAIERRARRASCSASRTSSATSSTASPPAGRVDEDYHPGDEVLIADGVHDARTKVLAADGAAGTVTVAAVRDPARRLEDRLRRAAPRPGGPRRAGALPTRRVLPPQVCVRTARRAITGAGSTRSGTWPTASTAAA